MKTWQRTLFWVAWIIFCIVCWIPTFNKYVMACDYEEEECHIPSAGLTLNLLGIGVSAQYFPYEEVVVEAEPEEEVEEEPQIEYIRIGSTAYYDSNHVGKVHGYTLQAGRTLAGKVEWRGKEVDLYKCNKDGSVGEYMGRYQFQDTGYGKPTGIGKTSFGCHKGKSMGDIEAGLTIDIFFNTYNDCTNYGRKDVYMVWID